MPLRELYRPMTDTPSSTMMLRRKPSAKSSEALPGEQWIQIRHLYLSPGHNFKGHHGRPPGTHPIRPVERIECVAGRGLVGDRYFDHKPDFKGQITFFDLDVYHDVCARLGAEVAPSALRRNVVTEGFNLNGFIGRTFRLGEVTFEGVEECRPCYWMDQAVAPGAEDALQGRGGLRARILTDGVLRLGPARLLPLT